VKLKVKYISYRNEGYAFVQVAAVFSCEFLTVEVVPIYACSQHVVTSINGTTSTEEMSTAKYSDATLPQKHDLHFWYFLYLRYKFYFSSVSMCGISKMRHRAIKKYIFSIIVVSMLY